MSNFPVLPCPKIFFISIQNPKQNGNIVVHLSKHLHRSSYNRREKLISPLDIGSALCCILLHRSKLRFTSRPFLIYSQAKGCDSRSKKRKLMREKLVFCTGVAALVQFNTSTSATNLMKNSIETFYSKQFSLFIQSISLLFTWVVFFFASAHNSFGNKRCLIF